MFGLGMWEVAVLFLVALLVLGPEKLPKVARKLGRGLREVRRAASELQVNLAEADREVRNYTHVDTSTTPEVKPATKSIEAETANATPETEPSSEIQGETPSETPADEDPTKSA